MKRRGLKYLAFALCVSLSLSISLRTTAYAAPSDTTRQTLDSLINTVKGSTGHKYGVCDNLGYSMDCAKIIANPYVSGQFIAVYHHYIGSNACVYLATSTDLMNWTNIKTLAGSSGANATQPSICVASDGGFDVAWEQEPNNHVKIAYYSSWSNLQNNIQSKSYDCPRQLSSYAEGTPNIYACNSTWADIGFHYYQNGKVDRQARGTMKNFNSWNSSAQSNYDNAILYWGATGNIGDRDGKLNFNGYSFNINEGQITPGDWSSWRVFLYDWATGNADKLAPITDAGSTAFANPTMTDITINGHEALLCTMFIPSEGAAGSESGELIYYNYINASNLKQNIALNKTATASQYITGEYPALAVDGSDQTYTNGNSKWCSNASGDKWLKLDLGQNYNISRWVVKHAGDGGENVAWNTKDFKLQTSSDGTNWTDVDTVIGNTANITDRTVSTFNTRYVRLYITNAGSDSVARIYEIELY